MRPFSGVQGQAPTSDGSDHTSCSNSAHTHVSLELEMSHGGNTVTTTTRKHYEAGLFPPGEPLMNTYQRIAAGAPGSGELPLSSS